MKKISILAWAAFVLLLCGCETPNVAYFGDLEHGTSIQPHDPVEISLRPGDKLTIVVNSRDAQISSLFNLTYAGQRLGAAASSASSGGMGLLSYTIDREGNIDFPVLGKLHIAGLRRAEVADMVKNELIKRDLVKDPVIIVDYAGLYFEVLGEVRSPGRYSFDRDKFTILEALSMAGDLTIQGRRDNVAVMRNENGKRTTYRINLLQGEDVYRSPVYYLQQDDIVYVTPNEKRANESTQNNNLLQTPTFWMSVTTFLMSLAVLIFK